MKTRNDIVKTAQSFIGCKESNGTHKKIIDIYNSHKPLARGYKVSYSDAWCATFVSAVAIKCGCTDIIPTECSCNSMIKLFQKLDSWQEWDGYTPKKGDIVFYDWQDNGKGDNVGSANHVGIIEVCNGSTITVIEGNKNNSVSRRIINVNGRYIRGYGTPKYKEPKVKQKTHAEIAKEVVKGKWGNGKERKERLEKAGYNYNRVQSIVNNILLKK